MYHYTECGLDNVWLQNGYAEHQTPYGCGVAVSDADQLHEVLALAIAKKAGRITGQELRFLRSMLDLSQGALGATLGVKDQSISLWERKDAITTAAEAVVRMLVVEKLEGNPRVADLLDKIATLDAAGHFVAKESRSGKWRATVSNAPTGSSICT
ncbi:MAG: transcriptional regulator [Rubrivivax sp.]|nr:transcriptional regulator [Rubrivivax sp.]